MVKLELTENEVLALKAVAYVCNKNSKLIASTYIENTGVANPRTISFYDALLAVFSIIDHIEEEQNG